MGTAVNRQNEIGRRDVMTNINGKTVLVVDDTPDEAATLRDQLEFLGMNVVGVAGDGAETMEMVSRLNPGLIIMDIKLSDDAGGEDGIDVAVKVLKQDLKPIILITGRPSDDYIDKACAAKLFSYLTKPLKLEELKAQIVLTISRTMKQAELESAIEELEKTLANRKIIEKAKGMLMRMLGIDENKAYEKIRKKSMEENKPIADIAKMIIMMHDLVKEDGRS